MSRPGAQLGKVYRFARNKSWIDRANGRFLPAAFVRRPHEAGLAVMLAPDAIPEGLGRVFGCGSLERDEVSRIAEGSQTLSLAEEPAGHWDIRGLPIGDTDKTAVYIHERLAAATATEWQTVATGCAGYVPVPPESRVWQAEQAPGNRRVLTQLRRQG
jgi:hypothetical protein